jgi:hypothetical protein
MIYKIKTLKDIYNLPTHEQVKTCLDEFTKIILEARDTNDLFVAIMRDKGTDCNELQGITRC